MRRFQLLPLCLNAGLDFDNATHYITIQKSGMNHIKFDIEIKADNISERQEVFLLVLFHTVQGTVPVNIQQDTAIVIIKESSKFKELSRPRISQSFETAYPR